MERGFTNRALGDDLIANGWLNWFDEAPADAAPRFQPASRLQDGPAAVHGGLRSQEMSAGAPAQAGGLWQRVAVPPGSEVLASVWVWSVASADPGATDLSDRPGNYAASLGLDAEGGEDPAAPNISWTAFVTFTDAWIPLSLQAPVESEEVTLFLKGLPLGDLPGSRSRWDDACLRVVGVAGEPTSPATPRPQPTAMPRSASLTETPSLAALEALATDVIAGATATGDAALAATHEAEARAALRATEAAVLSQRAAASAAVTQALPIPFGAWLADRLGLVAAGLAMLTLGVLIGYSRRTGRA